MMTEFAVVYTAIALPITFMVIFVAYVLWIYHGIVDFTRDGANYAASHCWLADGSADNVVSYMQSNVPAVIDQYQFQSGGSATINVQYFSENSDGTMALFDGSTCSGTCVPDAVSVSVGDYQFGRLAGFLRLPPITIPPFTTSVPMQSAGYQDASGTCIP
jgi:hypothetical protein